MTEPILFLQAILFIIGVSLVMIGLAFGTMSRSSLKEQKKGYHKILKPNK